MSIYYKLNNTESGEKVTYNSLKERDALQKFQNFLEHKAYPGVKLRLEYEEI